MPLCWPDPPTNTCGPGGASCLGLGGNWCSAVTPVNGCARRRSFGGRFQWGASLPVCFLWPHTLRTVSTVAHTARTAHRGTRLHIGIHPEPQPLNERVAGSF